MKILFVTPIDPLEDWHGGAVRSHFLWESLKQLGDVYTTVVCCEKGYDSTNGIKYVKQFSGIKSSIAVTRLAALSVVCPWVDWAFHGREYILDKIGWSGEHFDKVVVRLPQFMATNWFLFFEVAYWKIAPLYVDIDDLPSEDFKTTKRPYMSPKRGLLYYWLNIFWQSYLYRKSAGAWVANRFQRMWVVPFCRCAYLPNVVKLRGADDGVRSSSSFNCLVIGRMDYKPNESGVDWFLKNVWKSACLSCDNIRLLIVGSKLREEQRMRWEKYQGVHVKGYVKDIADAYIDCDAVVVPVLSGGGTCIKLIEALSFGKKVLSTPFGARGLGAADRERAHIDLFTDADEFVRHMNNYRGLAVDRRNDVKSDVLRFARSEYAVEKFDVGVGKLIGCL